MEEALERGRVYDHDEWPHGLRCAECDHLYEDGDRYESVFESMLDDGSPIMLILCVPCAWKRGS